MHCGQKQRRRIEPLRPLQLISGYLRIRQKNKGSFLHSSSDNKYHHRPHFYSSRNKILYYSCFKGNFEIYFQYVLNRLSVLLVAPSLICSIHFNLTSLHAHVSPSASACIHYCNYQSRIQFIAEVKLLWAGPETTTTVPSAYHI